MKKKFLIVGAGPAGLALACSLLKKGEDDLTIIEEESSAGGLCRSEEVDGSPLDIGGGHFLDVRRPEVDDFLFEYLPRNEWNLFERDSRIVIGDTVINHPLEANIWQMSLDNQVQYLKSIAVAGCNIGEEMPERFVEWIYWKLGEKIANDYMLPYNLKMFGDDLDELGTYWLEKLPDVSFEETLMGCLTKRPYGRQPGHAQFFYPKRYGYGEVWLRMAESLGGRIIYNEPARILDLDKRVVNDKYEADVIINTAPWTSYTGIKGLTDELKEGVKSLKSSGVVVDYFPEDYNTKAQWVYYPSLRISYHRILVRHNFLPGAKGHWTETRLERELLRDRKPPYGYTSIYSYPLNTTGKPEIMKKLLAYTGERGVIGLGRWGHHNHYNSDLVVEQAMELAGDLAQH